MVKELIEECRVSKRELAMGYQDVGSAFPNVSHRFVQFTLWYFHVPQQWAALLFTYYENVTKREGNL